MGATQTKSASLDEALGAAYSGDVDVFTKLVNEQPQLLTQSNEDLNCALGMACAGGREDIVRLILERDASLSEHRNNIGTSPLWLAAGYGHANIVELLVDKGCDTNAANTSGDTPLIAASSKGHAGVVRMLLQCGADCRRTNNGKDNALGVAIAAGHAECVQCFVDHCAATAAALAVQLNAKGANPLATAILSDRLDILSLVLSSNCVDLSVVDVREHTLLALAEAEHKTEACEMLAKAMQAS